MAKSIKPADLGTAIEQQLTVYHKDVTAKVNDLSKEAAAKLAKITRRTAPVGERGDFKRSITSGVKEKRRNGDTYAWYVKAPNYRLTHLLVHGHATRNGGRTRANPFLANACKQVLPEYEDAIKEAVRDGK